MESNPAGGSQKKGFECSVDFCLNLMKWFNIGVALFVIGYGFYQYIHDGVNIDSFASFFSPFYLILFGSLLICAEMEFILMVKYFKFLDNLFGRGIYNIFIATIVVNSLPISLNNSSWMYVFSIILTVILLSIGLTYIILYICRCGQKSKKFQEIDEEEAKNSLNQNLLNQPPEPPKSLTIAQWQQLQNNPQEYTKWLQAQLSKIQLQQQSLEGPKIT